MENKTMETIKSVLFLVFFGGAIFGMYIFSQTKPMLCFCCFGAILMFFAVLALVSMIKEGEKNPISYLAPVLVTYAGGALVVIPLLLLYVPSFVGADRLRVGVTAAVLGFFLCGVGIIVMRTASLLRNRKCTVPVSAKCIDRVFRASNQGTSGHTKRRWQSYAYVFEFEYQGATYTVQDDIASNMDGCTQGFTYELWINPADPTHFYRKTPRQTIAFYVMGACFVLASVLVFCVY